MPYKDREIQKRFQRIFKRKRLERLRDLKKGPCVDCSGIFHPAAMQWDHIDATIKFKDVAKMAQYRFERALEEIKKCELVCANCHAVRTYNRIEESRLDRETA